MKTSKRKLFLILITTLTLLCTYQFIDIYLRFSFLLVDILNNLSENIIVYMLFVLFISLTGFVSIGYNLRLMINPSTKKTTTTLIDEIEMIKPKQFGLGYYIYVIFSGLVTSLGLYILFVLLQETYPIQKLPMGLHAYMIALLDVGAGFLLIKDVRNIKQKHAFEKK